MPEAWAGQHEQGAERQGAERRTTRHRPARLVETLVRATMTGATEQERNAVALAERLAIGAWAAFDVDPEMNGPLRMMVAAEAAERLAERRRSFEEQLVRTLLHGLWPEWQAHDASAAMLAASLVPAAVELAWLLTPDETEAAPNPPDAVARAREHAPADDAIWDALAAAAQSHTLERRMDEQAA